MYILHKVLSLFVMKCVCLVTECIFEHVYVLSIILSLVSMYMTEIVQFMFTSTIEIVD